MVVVLPEPVGPHKIKGTSIPQPRPNGLFKPVGECNKPSTNSFARANKAVIWENYFCAISGALFCTLDGDSGGCVQPRDEVRINRGARFGLVFANRVAVVAGDIELCVGVSWHGPKHSDGDKEYK